MSGPGRFGLRERLAARSRASATPAPSTELSSSPLPSQERSLESSSPAAGYVVRDTRVPRADGIPTGAPAATPPPKPIPGRGRPCPAAAALPGPASLADDLAAVAPVPRAGLCRQTPAVLLDLETTGLSRDAGCVPFLVGLAWHDSSDAIVVRQWTLQSLSAEAAMLADVARCLEAHTRAGAAIVTFNGASFDLPLLRLRWVRTRVVRPGAASAVDRVPHFDLLHPARRMWKGRGPDCRLVTLERLLLSVERQGDVPGAEIPMWYERWLRAPHDPAATAALRRIERHNRLDLLSLLGLAGQLGARLRAPGDAEDAVRAAEHHLRRERLDQALAVVGPSLTRLGLASPEASASPDSDSRGGPSPLARGVARRIVLVAAEVHRRLGEHERAAALWAWVCDQHVGEPEAHDRLAKFLEHRQRDPAAALAVAAASADPCARRLARLRRKLGAGVSPPLASALRGVRGVAAAGANRGGAAGRTNLDSLV